jgi:Kef-type K+ transport system membrane component KefB/mannitol/fructose-specific phosphotransferase system IIA component (Ntr-type)/nucleotide-binding universal stress UspA family protein
LTLLAVTSLTLPLTDPVLIVGVAMILFLVVPVLFERLRLPGIIGILLAGAVVGPHGTGVLERDATIVLLGTVGLLYLVFLAALDLDLHRFARYRSRSLVFGAISFAAPALLAVAVLPALGYSFAASALFGAIVGSHTLLAYPLVGRLGLAKNLAVTTVVGGTLVTDTLSLAVLAVVSGALGATAGAGFWATLVLSLTVYVTAVMLIVPRLGRWFFRRLPGEAPAEFIFLMALLFTSAFAARAAGAQPIIGAFLAGLAINRLIPESGPLMNRVRFVGNALFIPFFLLSVGMLVDFRVLTESGRMWILAIVLTALVMAGKFVGAAAAWRLYRYSGAEAGVMLGLSVPQAAATLAVTFVGLEIGLFDEVVVNAVIVVILVTATAGPLLVQRFGRQVALQEARRPYDPSEAPERILIPISNPATAEELLDLAFALRSPDSREPLYPLMVVPESETSADPLVAEAEKMLGHAVFYAAGADVPVVPLTRVDHNVATGVSRGIAETRSSVVILGWDGRRTTGRAMFGSVLDQILERSRQMVMVARLGHPLNTTQRIVLVVPPALDRHPGFVDALRTVRVLANRLGASMSVLAVDTDAAALAKRTEKVRPEVPATWETVPRWGVLYDRLRAVLRPEDLVVALSARQGTLPWHPRLDRMPGALVTLAPESFIIVYPPEGGANGEPADAEAADAGLRPDHVAHLDGVTGYEAALAALVQPLFADEARGRVARALAEDAARHSTELMPGVVLAHMRTAGLEKPLLSLGVSDHGVQFPNARVPARLILALVSPTERADAHLRSLAEIARALITPQAVAELVRRIAPDAATDWIDAGR